MNKRLLLTLSLDNYRLLQDAAKYAGAPSPNAWAAQAAVTAARSLLKDTTEDDLPDLGADDAHQDTTGDNGVVKLKPITGAG